MPRTLIAATLTLAVLAIGALAPAPAHAALRGIDGKCKVHMGHLVIAGGVDHLRHVRIGPKDGHVGGSHRCHGRYKRRVHSLSGSSFQWFAFDYRRWNWKGIGDVTDTGGQTAAACGGFAATFAATFPEGSALLAVRAGAIIGCGKGIIQLGGPVIDAGVRLIK